MWSNLISGFQPLPTQQVGGGANSWWPKMCEAGLLRQQQTSRDPGFLVQKLAFNHPKP